jgi:hypothetical protein
MRCSTRYADYRNAIEKGQSWYQDMDSIAERHNQQQHLQNPKLHQN